MTKLQPNPTDKDSKSSLSLQEIAATQIKLEQLIKDLEIALDSFVKNQSILTRMANAWNSIPFWVKIVIGCGSIIPLTIVALMTHVAALIVVSLFLTLTYFIGGYLLKEHHQHAELSTEPFKNIVTHLVILLGNMITLLHEVHSQLKEEVERFRVQNVLLEEQVKNISDELATHKVHNQKLLETQSRLHDIIKNLEHTSTTLQVQTEEHVVLLAKVQKEHEHTQKELDATQEELVKANKKMEEMNLAAQESLQKANHITAVLNDTLNGLIKSMSITNEQQKSSLLKKISAFVEGSEVCLSDFSLQLNETTDSLAQLSSQYAQSLSKIDDLAQKQQTLMDHLSEVLPSPPSTPIQPAATLTTLGIFATTTVQEETTHKLPLAIKTYT